MKLFLRAIPILVALLAGALLPGWWCGRDAAAWFDADPETQSHLAEALIAFEAADDTSRASVAPAGDRFAGEWALVTHQMVALGLAQLCLARSVECPRYLPTLTRAAVKSFLPEMRDFGTHAWSEDVLASLGSSHGHAYFGYAALAVGMARLLDPAFPKEIAAQHDLVIAAFERRLLASPTGLIETYPNEAYPTDVASVAAAIAVHGRVNGVDHREVIARWAERVRGAQIDRASGLVIQRMGALDGKPHDAPRGSGTGLAAYFAGFADRGTAELLTEGLRRQEASFLGFGGIREYAPGHTGKGDVDSGPVLLGISVSATGFALAPLRAFGHRDDFTRIYRTTALFGVPFDADGSSRFLTGGAIGNALLLALLTSGPELAP
ncbi:MAG: hypothetical protein ABI193_24730 [Minicystis sp.]